MCSLVDYRARYIFYFLFSVGIEAWADHRKKMLQKGKQSTLNSPKGLKILFWTSLMFRWQIFFEILMLMKHLATVKIFHSIPFFKNLVFVRDQFTSRSCYYLTYILQVPGLWGGPTKTSWWTSNALHTNVLPSTASPDTAYLSLLLLPIKHKSCFFFASLRSVWVFVGLCGSLWVFVGFFYWHVKCLVSGHD